MSTIIYSGQTYTISLDGGNYPYGEFAVGSGDAVCGGTFGNFELDVSSGALSDGNTFSVLDGVAELNVEAGGFSYMDSINHFGQADISGTASDISAGSGSGVYVYAGGAVYSGQFFAASELIYPGGNDYNSTFITGGQAVEGTAMGAIIKNGGGQATAADGIAYNSVVESGSRLDGNSGGTFVTPLLETGALAILYSGSALDGATLDGGTINAEAGSDVTGSISFTSAGGLVTLASAEPEIAGFNAESRLDLTGSTLPTQKIEVDSDSFAVDFGGGNIETFTGIDGNMLDVTFTTSGDVVNDILCFTAGTRIQTPHGKVAVENLAIGDKVTTHDGGESKIKFIGTRSYAGRFIAGNHLALPVTITKDAIADHVPARDLTVSPGHGIFIDGVIVPAWRVVNGKSVTQASAVKGVDYFHIELANGHAILLAENCPAESYLDIGTRTQFHNAAEFYEKYPEDAGKVQTSCAPRVESGFQLEAIQNRIAARAGIMPQARQNGALRGFVDQAGNEGFVSGWAQSIAQPEMPVVLRIYAGGVYVARVLANAYRRDLREAGIGSGCHGFACQLPTVCAGTIEVRREADGAVLPWTNAARQAAA